jgi:hypothetical protein
MKASDDKFVAATLRDFQVALFALRAAKVPGGLPRKVAATTKCWLVQQRVRVVGRGACLAVVLLTKAGWKGEAAALVLEYEFGGEFLALDRDKEHDLNIHVFHRLSLVVRLERLDSTDFVFGRHWAGASFQS